jgi:hypothetical protein
MSSGNKQLMKLIRQGISSRYHNAKYRTPWSPKPRALFAGKTVQKQGKDGIFRQVG